MSTAARLSLQTLEAPARTLARPISLRGVGVHSGAPATLTLAPADAPGWWLESGGERARVEEARLVGERWQTALALPGGARMATVEHALAVISGLHLDAVTLKLEGPEAPILDGSARPILEAVLEAGLRELSWARSAWSLDAALRVDVGEAWMEARPYSGRALSCALDFDGALPAEARAARWEDAGDFGAALAPARTFAFEAWVDKLRESGMIQGGSLACAVIFDAEGRALNPEGLRTPNEPARHKLLDALGDLALLGRPLLASVELHRPGHHVHHSWLRALRAPSTPAGGRP